MTREVARSASRAEPRPVNGIRVGGAPESRVDGWLLVVPLPSEPEAEHPLRARRASPADRVWVMFLQRTVAWIPWALVVTGLVSADDIVDTLTAELPLEIVVAGMLSTTEEIPWT